MIELKTLPRDNDPVVVAELRVGDVVRLGTGDVSFIFQIESLLTGKILDSKTRIKVLDPRDGFFAHWYV